MLISMQMHSPKQSITTLVFVYVCIVTLVHKYIQSYIHTYIHMQSYIHMHLKEMVIVLH